MIRTARTVERGPDNFWERLPQQSRVLLVFQAAVLALVMLQALRAGLFWTALIMAATYVALAEVSVRQAWTGLARAVFVVLGTLWVAKSHWTFIGTTRAFLALSEEGGPAAAMGAHYLGFISLMALFGWPLLVYLVLRFAIPKSG